MEENGQNNGRALMHRTIYNHSAEFIRESFDKGTAYLKSRASDIWTLKKSKVEAWSIGEWSKHVKYLAILKNGVESDKEKLPAATRYSETHRRPRK
jgi:hypothetical protein